MGIENIALVQLKPIVGEMFGATSVMVGKICPPPPGWNRVKVSEILGVAPVDTFL